MARIRSVHPGLFTDEAFMGLSSDAQILLIGLWTEADDQGVFEWKPITLRARLRPTKDGSIEPLLAELVAADCIRKWEINGRQLGAIRNFGKFQRPKSPKSVHLITEDVRKYAGSTHVITEIDGDEPPPLERNGEKSSQREEGGGREGGKDTPKPPRGHDGLNGHQAEFEEFYQAFPVHKGRGQAERAYLTALRHAESSEILVGARRFAELMRGSDPKFIAHPATWLNGKRWLDEKVDQPRNPAAEHDALYRKMGVEI